MAVNKVVLGENTLIDLTGDTVSADKLAKGTTAHDMAGEPIVGTMEAGGGVPDNMVTTDTNQTITGTKTFSDIRLNSDITSGISDFSGNKILLVRTDLNPKKVDVGYNSHDLQLNSQHPVVVYDGNYVKTLATTDQIPTVEANPENPTQTLSSIKIGDVDYSVGGGGGDYLPLSGGKLTGTLEFDNQTAPDSDSAFIKCTGTGYKNQTPQLVLGTSNLEHLTIGNQYLLINSEVKSIYPQDGLTSTGAVDLGRATGPNKWKFKNAYFGGIVEASNIPAPPSTDGEYNLHCSIVGGVPTYTWKAE